MICETDNERIGYMWVSFIDVDDYNFTIAEIEDIFIDEKWRRKGFASQLIKYSELKSRALGANVLRIGTGFDNAASKKLHIKTSFKPYRIEYEKILNKE